MQNIHFIDKSFDFTDVSKYHLSLQVFLKGFSFSVLDRSRNKYVALAHYAFNRITSYHTLAKLVDEIIDKEPLLQCPFSHVKLLFATDNYTFVPSAFFSEENKTDYFKFNQDKKNSEELFTNYIFGNSSYVIFCVPSVLVNLFRSRYPNVHIYHQSVPIIEELTLKSKMEDTGKRVLVNIYPAIFDFVLIEGREIIMFNTFSYKSVADFNYYFLNAVDNMKLSPLTTQISVCGMLPSDHQILESMKKYIQNISFFAKPAHFEYAYGFNDVPSYYFTNMINLYQCG